LPVRGATAAASDVGVMCRACPTLALKRLIYWKMSQTSITTRGSFFLLQNEANFKNAAGVLLQNEPIIKKKRHNTGFIF